VRKTRGLHRARRQRAPWPVIALVGYTNAGKSTLFNHLTGSDVMAEDLLFATLDPTMRQISLPGIDKAILSDTVGFVSDLPTQLVAAFRATLEEVTAADVIVHVRDIAHPDTDAQVEDVRRVLAEIGIADGHGAPMIEAWNKIDMLDAESADALHAEAARKEDVVPLSALTGEGVEDLCREVADRLRKGSRVRTLMLDPADGAAIAWLHRHGEVIGQEMEAERVAMDVRLTDAAWARFQSRAAGAA
jgi:GTP-binding protein HflX